MENQELSKMLMKLLDEKLRPLDDRLQRLEGGQQVIIDTIESVSKKVACRA
ncbi:hypothetical protein [Gracilibacillus massiliensis]|uniref:hypothetical protein n=1 Tax=Gracilibacillus massiliensis TaxID=1564956 RepID=UPI000B332D71|nr:hypothetical protein [Gracilibacillus massiliensis]